MSQHLLHSLVDRLSPRKRAALLVAGGLLAAYGLTGFFGVPWLLRSQIGRQSSSRLHRTATVTQVRFNPFTLTTRLIGFDLRDRDGTALVAWDTLRVNLELASVIQRAWVIKEIRLVRPVMIGRIADNGRPAIADLFEPDSTGQPTPKAVPSRPPRLKVRRLTIQDGSFAFVDESRTPRYTEAFEDLGLDLEGFSTLPREEGDHVLTVSFATGAEVRWSGTVVTQPLRLNGHFELSRLQLPRIARVLGDRFPLSVTQGEGAATFDYTVDQAEDGGLRVAVHDAGIDVQRVAVRPSEATSDWLRVARVEARGLRILWPLQSANIDLVRITEPWIAAARRADGTLDWKPYLEALRPSQSAAADSGRPWSATCTTLEVVDGGVHFEDRTVAPTMTFDLANINVHFDSITSDPSVRLGLTASATSGASATFSVRGGLTRNPFAADLDIALTGLDLRKGQPYLGSTPPAVLAAGTASVKGTVRMRSGRPATVFEGDASLDGVRINEPSGDSLLAWRATRIREIRLTTAPDRARIRLIEIIDPFARIAISRDHEINLAGLATLIPQSAPEDRFPYEIVEVAIRNATIDFSDESLILPFRTTIHSATAALKDVASFGATPGSLELEGKIDSVGLARATGTLHVNDPYAATSIDAEFRRVEMARLSPYTIEFMGYPVTEGRLDVDLRYQILNRQLRAEHHVVASNMQLGEKAEGGGGPGFGVKLALSLLKDREGRVKLDPLVEGSVDDPQFNYSAVMWQAINQILGKIATAPFRFLGNLLGIGGDEIELVEFDPGRTEIIAPEREKLDSLAVELGRKPELMLAIEGRFDSLSDVEAIREARLKALIEARREGTASATARADTSVTALARILEDLFTEQFTRAVFDSLQASFGPERMSVAFYAEVRNRLLAAQPVEPGQLEQLGRDRGAAIASALLTGGVMDSTRIRVTDPAPVKRKKTGSSRVASEMSMDAK